MRHRQLAAATLVFVGAALGGAFCNWLLLGAPALASAKGVRDHERTMVARAFVVVNEKGIPRAALGLDRSGGVAMRLLDKRGRQRVRVIVEDYGRPAVELMDKEEKIVWNAP